LEAAEEVARNWLGQHIRVLRTSKGLTLRDMLGRTGLSPSTLSKIENGRLSVTFDKLVLLARALEVDVSQLLSSADHHAPNGRRSITRNGEGEIYSSPQYTYRMLCADLAKKKIIPLLARVEQRELDAFDHLVRHEGEEFIYVLEGEVELHTEFYETITLRPGDCAYFDSRMGHALTCRQGNGHVLWISTIPEHEAGAGLGFVHRPGRQTIRHKTLQPAPAKRARSRKSRPTY